MSWLYWTIIGLCAVLIVMFFVSCAILNHHLERYDRDRDRGDWY